jgi:NADPH:quinone reductase-like Zn-dependent oxidoreductase
LYGVVMRVAGIRATSEPVETIDVGDPHALAFDEVLINVKAASVANWDAIVRDGHWDVGISPPMALGTAAAGVIAAVGSGAAGWSEGDAVLTHPLPLRHQGTWAPRLIAPAEALARKPPGVPWDKAAAFPVPALTAEQALVEALGIGTGETLLVNGAGGVTGSLLVGLGAVHGAEVTALASPFNHERLKALGASHVLDYHDPGWVDRARKTAGGGGVDAAVNAVPGGAGATIDAVRDSGRLATITSDPPDAQRRIAVAAVYVRPDGPQLERLAELLAKGRLSIEVGSTFPLEQAASALETALNGTSGRAVVIAL